MKWSDSEDIGIALHEKFPTAILSAHDASSTLSTPSLFTSPRTDPVNDQSGPMPPSTESYA